MQSSYLKFSFPVLVGDIGGTNARFTLISDSGSSVGEPVVISTHSAAGICEALQQVLPAFPLKPQSTVLAVAGPVRGEEIFLTNCNWVIRPEKVMKDIGLSNILIINDFEAQALAVAVPDKANLKKIGGEKGQDDGPRLVLGPGTGLGVCALFGCSGRWIPIPGEGGHVDMGPRTPSDYAIFSEIQKIVGRVSAETILSGQGLLNVYQALASTKKKKAKLTSPASITDAALSGSDSLSYDALMFFAQCLGRISGDLAMVFMTTGGVFLTGGIPQRIMPFLQNGAFRAAFEDKAPHRALLEKMPVFLVTNPWAPLEGLAAYVNNPARFEIGIKGRFWSQM